MWCFFNKPILTHIFCILCFNIFSVRNAHSQNVIFNQLGDIKIHHSKTIDVSSQDTTTNMVYRIQPNFEINYKVQMIEEGYRVAFLGYKANTLRCRYNLVYLNYNVKYNDIYDPYLNKLLSNHTEVSSTVVNEFVKGKCSKSYFESILRRKVNNEHIIFMNAYIEEINILLTSNGFKLL